MSVKSFRALEVPQSNAQLSKGTASASTLQELINTIPQSYRVQLGDYLTKKYRVAHKHANVESTVAHYQRYELENSFPPIIRNSLKEPKLQFAKEYLSTTEGSSGPENFHSAVLLARKQVLAAAIREKKKELLLLAGLIKSDEEDWQKRALLVANQSAISFGGTMQWKSGQLKTDKLPDTFAVEFGTVIGACSVYTYRCLALARASIDRTDLQKLSKMKLKETTDIEMADAPTRDQGVAELVKEQIQSLKKDLMAQLGTSSPAQKRSAVPLTTHSTKRQKVQHPGQENFPQREEESEWEWRAEGKEGQEVSLDHYLQVCSKHFRPWSADTFPNMYLSLNDTSRHKISLAFMREWEVDSLRAAAPGIFKLDGVELPEDIEYTLAVNHKYILHSKPQEHDVTQARDALARSIRVRWQFRHSQNKEFVPKFHVPNPTWQPQHASPAIELGIQEAVEEIDRQIGQALSRAALSAPRHGNMNWTRVQRFLQDNALLVKLTDKNLGLAVFPREWYISEVMKMLTEGDTYHTVPQLDVDKLHQKLIEKLVKWKLPPNMDKFVREKTRKQIPVFHAIPKVHKTPWSLRPIVPSHSWVTSCLSQVVDHLCRPILDKLPWVVDSSKQVINNLEAIGTDFEDVWICTGDVVAFYTNIDSEECAHKVASAYEYYFPKSRIRGQTLAQMIKFIMDHNYFSFQDQVWKQQGGLAMGTSCAPVLANIYAASFERHKIVDLPGVLLYNRYIDDIACIFKGSLEKLTTFQKKVKLGSLVVKWDCSKLKNEFLDIEILRIENRLQPKHLATRLFRKPMNRFLYIPWSSAHPLHVKKAFVKAELIRFATVSSQAEYFADARRQFYGNLRRRGYPPQVLDAWFTQVCYSQRQIFLAPRKDKEDQAPLMLAGQYNPVWEFINVDQILRKALPAWSLEKELPESLTSSLIRSLRRTTSLGDLLSVWNKTTLHPVNTSSETSLTGPVLAAPSGGLSLVVRAGR
jgi:hypothetical protein